MTVTTDNYNAGNSKSDSDSEEAKNKIIKYVEKAIFIAMCQVPVATCLGKGY
jgi:hypothetical protein